MGALLHYFFKRLEVLAAINVESEPTALVPAELNQYFDVWIPDSFNSKSSQTEIVSE